MRFFIGFTLLAFLSGCRPIPPYTPPLFQVPSAWKEASSTNSETSQLTENIWWSVFNDSLLNDLITKGLENSPTLASAAWKTSEAWAIAQASLSPLYPTVLFAPGTSNNIQLINTSGFSPLTTTAGQATALNSAFSPLRRIKTTQYNLPFITSYEFDLWGKFRYGAESAYANAEAQEDAWLAVRLSLTTAIANAYFTIRTYDAEEKVLINTINSRTEAFEINQIRYKAGLINYADVSRAETEVWTARADLSFTKNLRAQQEHFLAVLIGQAPSSFEQQSLPLEGAPPLISAILPSEVLQRRPDLNQAERELASLYAQEGFAYASLFPSLSISTELGYSAPIVGELLNWKARLFSLAFDGLQTLFDAGKKEADIKAARARFEQSINSYSDKILSAFKEVENALSGIKWQEKVFNEYSHAVESAQISKDLASERYTRGLVSYLEVVDAERTLLATQLNMVRAQGDRFISTVDLVKSIGGSWSDL